MCRLSEDADVARLCFKLLLKVLKGSSGPQRAIMSSGGASPAVWQELHSVPYITPGLSISRLVCSLAFLLMPFVLLLHISHLTDIGDNPGLLALNVQGAVYRVIEMLLQQWVNFDSSALQSLQYLDNIKFVADNLNVQKIKHTHNKVEASFTMRLMPCLF